MWTYLGQTFDSEFRAVVDAEVLADHALVVTASSTPIQLSSQRRGPDAVPPDRLSRQGRLLDRKDAREAYRNYEPGFRRWVDSSICIDS